MFYLGIDGGGTKTAFLLIDEEGKIWSYIVKEGINYIQIGLDKLKQVLAEGILNVLEEANIRENDISFSFLGIPCFGEFKENDLLLENIAKRLLKYRNFKCGNDVEASWAGSLAYQPGISIVAGTGAVGFGRDSQGNIARAGGWDYFFGDEGSGYWMGKKVLLLFAKESDGREERTPIYNIVRKKFNLQNDLDLMPIIYNELAPKRDEIAKLALLLDQAVEHGDKKAVEIFNQAAYELSLIVSAIINKLNFKANKNILVSYSGGIFKSGNYILKPMKSYIYHRHKNVKLVKPILRPVIGAALYAMLLDGKTINDSIIQNLKNQEKKFMEKVDKRGKNDHDRTFLCEGKM